MGVGQERFVELERRIGLFTSLPTQSLDRLALQARLEEIGKSEIPVDEDDG